MRLGLGVKYKSLRARRLADKCARFLLSPAAPATSAWEEVERLPVVAAAAARLTRAAVQAVSKARPCDNHGYHGYRGTCQVEAMKKEVAKLAEA